MTTRTDITRTGGHADGTFDRTMTAQYYMHDEDDGTYWLDALNVSFSDDPTLNTFHQYHIDYEGHPWLEQILSSATASIVTEVTKAWNTAGQQVHENISHDLNGDGQVGDAETSIGYTFNTAGLPAATTTNNYSWGELIPAESIVETYFYNAAGQQTLTTQINQARFGTTRPQTTEMFTWNADGTPRTEIHLKGDDNPWDVYTPRADYAYVSWNNEGYDRVTIKLNFKEKVVIEKWHNADGNMTSSITSWDDGAPGGPIVRPLGGFDRQDVLTQVWDGDFMLSSTTDLGNDGIIDTDFTSTFLIA